MDDRVRRSIYVRDHYVCRYCGAQLRPRTPKESYRMRRRNVPPAQRPWPTVDHVRPRSRGGSDDPENLVTACRPCNTQKGDRTPEEADMALRPISTRRIEEATQ